jgi:hypothetical protein
MRSIRFVWDWVVEEADDDDELKRMERRREVGN